MHSSVRQFSCKSKPLSNVFLWENIISKFGFLHLTTITVVRSAKPQIKHCNARQNISFQCLQQLLEAYSQKMTFLLFAKQNSLPINEIMAVEFFFASTEERDISSEVQNWIHTCFLKTYTSFCFKYDSLFGFLTFIYGREISLSNLFYTCFIYESYFGISTFSHECPYSY